MLENINEVIVLKVNCSQEYPDKVSVTGRAYFNEYESECDDMPTSGPLKSMYFDGYKLDEQQLLTKLLEFIGSKVIVVHDGGLEIHLMNHGCDLFNIDRISNAVIDTRKLAQLVYQIRLSMSWITCYAKNAKFRFLWIIHIK